MSFLVNIVTNLIEWFYNITAQMGIPSYAIAIVILTVLIKIVLYPLTYKQMKSMKVMQELQPKIKELDKKYKNDPQKKQQAMMEMYKEYGANPLSGCLPLLVQMPILFALFRALQNFVPTNPEHYKLFSLSLSQPDAIVLPLLVGLSTFAQQYVTSPNSNDQTQKTMLYMMPLLFGFMSRSFPAGLALYWIMFSLVGTIQQVLINKSIKPVEAKEDASAQ